MKQRTHDKLKSKVLQRQFATDEHVRRLRSQVEYRSQIRQMSNEELKRQKSLAKERLEDELSKMYKAKPLFLN